MKEIKEIENPPSVAILTNFMDFNPGYSLTGIVIDQAHMLAKNGHRVLIYVNEQYNPQYEEDSGLSHLQFKYPSTIEVRPKTKFMHLTDYEKLADITNEHRIASKEFGEKFAEEFKEKGIHYVFTHDFIFTGWNLPYAESIKVAHHKLVNCGQAVKWFHWVHSVPSGHKDWWDLDAYGFNHEIIFPNKTEIMRVCEAFRTTANRVQTVPHIKDIRNWYDFSPESMTLIDQYPEIMKAEVIQVYPCSTDRMSAKQLNLVFKIFSHMKLTGQKKVFLIVANQWATGRQRKEDVDVYIENAEKIGLISGKDFCFTSKTPGHETGISKRMLRELTLLSNVFIFPTREESFGLVGPEAAFGGCLPIINKSLTMMYEVMGTECPAFEFGSFHNNAPVAADDNYLLAVALAILSRMYADESSKTKTFCRLRYNMDHLYSQKYLPLLNNL